jgi:hypothetical protein
VRAFWPAAEAAQVDYEALRAAVLAGAAPVGPAASRFWRTGLAVRRPGKVQPVFVGRLEGAARPPWTPHADPRLDALVGGYELVLAVVCGQQEDRNEEVAQ